MPPPFNPVLPGSSRMVDGGFVVVRSSLVLVHTTGMRESMSADASFTSSFTGMASWDFGIGAETIANAEKAPSFAPSIRRIKERWTACSVDVPYTPSAPG